MDDLAAMARLIDALRPWLGYLVIVGGWAHQLHRYHPGSKAPLHRALRTKDADVAFASGAPLVGDIGAAMKAAGFEVDFSGEHTPPVAQYRVIGDDQGFYVEFLTPLYGSGYKRDGRPDATLAKAGVTAQRLHHLQLLLEHPWVVRVGDAGLIPLIQSADVMVANPASFIAQKLLIQKERPPEKQAQDVLYIHDTLELFGHDLETLRAEWFDHVRPTLAPKTARSVERLRRTEFSAVTDVIRAAARIPQDRKLTPDRLQATCAHGLDEIFRNE